MQSASPYIPYPTHERHAPLSDDILTKHKNAFFESIRVESVSKRAEALAQLGSNLIAWSRLAYPEMVDRTTTSGHVDNDKPRPAFHRDVSGEGVFNLDDEDMWSHDQPQSTKYGSPEDDVRAQTPPWSANAVLSPRIDYGEYSMYGVEDTVFDPARPTSELKEILKSYLLTVLRASVDCPFADVRRYCRYILHQVFAMGANVPDLICDGPSWLIPARETIAYRHDAVAERSQSEARPASDDDRGSFSFLSSSFNSDTSDLTPHLGSLKRIKSGIATPVASPSRNNLASFTTQDLDDIVFASDDDTDSRSNASPELAESVTSETAPDPAVSAIPITNTRKSSRAPTNPSEIDEILLGSIESRTGQRKARFSLDPIARQTDRRPALSRKRTNSTTYTIHQRRASHSLRAFHLSCYINTGRVSNLGRILSYFPRFYEFSIMLHDDLIRKQGGPLQRVIKLYLSILSAAQAKCQYLTSYFSKKFIQLGLHKEWLEGLDKAPRKLQRLGKLNSLLSKQPWRIQKHHIEELLTRSQESIDKGDASDQWTMGELVQSICILIYVNCQAHFCLATGIVPEPDTFGGACIRTSKKEKGRNSSSVDVLPLFTSYDSRAFASPASYNQSYNQTRQETIPEEPPCIVIPNKPKNEASHGESPMESEDEDTIPSLLWKRRQSFNQSKLWAPKSASIGTDNAFNLNSTFAQCGLVGDESFIPTDSPFWASANLIRKSPGADGLLSPFPSSDELAASGSAASTMPVNPVLEDMSRFYDANHQLSPQDFDLQDKQTPVLRLVDCNWEDHTCSLIGRFVPDLEQVIDQILQEARVAAGDDDEGFFFNTENGASVDQGPLRDAVWFFILRLYGIYNDGYDYTDVNLLLNKSAKQFLKKVCHFPELINRHDWQSIGKGLKSQERVLLALLATHARMYACLVYAFRYCQ